MIQRIQTIFLILAALCFGALFKLPLLTSTSSSAQFLADHIYSIQDHLILLSITCFAIGMSVLSIFMYKNRKLQRKLVYCVIILAIALSIAAYFILKMNGAEAFSFGDSPCRQDYFFTWQAWYFAFLPAIILVRMKNWLNPWIASVDPGNQH
jgi:uncharacterized membrane protein YwzB